MKLTLPTTELLTQLQTVTRVASTRSAVQALSGVMVLAGDSGAELLATDTEVGLRVPLQAEVARSGQVLLPARLLLDVVRALPAEELSLELRPSEQDVELLCGGAIFHLRTLRAEDFPALPSAAEESTHDPSRRGLRADHRASRSLGIPRRDQARAHRAS